MLNPSEQMTTSGITCASCAAPVVPGTRAVVFTAEVAYHRACWSWIVCPDRPTAVEKRMARNWTTRDRCRVTA